MSIYNIRIIVLLVSLSFLLYACNHKANEPIRIGINPWPGYEFLYLAQEKGFYKDVGIDVKIIEYGSLNDVRRGYERGNLDAMATTLIEVLQVKNNSNRDPMIFLAADYSDGGDVIIAKSTITSVSDLKGKRIAADTTSLPIFILARALDKNGLKLSDVTVVPLEQSEIKDAYLENRIDAVVTYPPLSVELKKDPNSHLIFTSKEIPGEVIDVVSIERSVYNSRKQDIKKIIQAWDKAISYSKQNPKDAIAIMAKREGITPDEFSDALADLAIIPLADQKKHMQTIKDTLHNVKDVLVSTGVFSKETSAECCLANDLY